MMEKSKKQTKYALDDMDTKIIRELQANGKITYKEIAQKLDVSDGMVRFRVDRLLKKDILKISASVNPMYFDNCVAALIGINLEKREHRVIMNKIATMKGVCSVCNLTGRYDLMVEVFFDSREELRRFLMEDLGDIGGVTFSETFIYLDAVNKWLEL
jgi:Lrp/AsnC family transcriptional regulator for asnA, asnC and gidA